MSRSKRTSKVKNRILIVVVIAFLIAIIGGTYSRYSSSGIGEGVGEIAKWHIVLGTQDISSVAKTFNVPVTDVGTSENVAEGKLAPGKTVVATFNIDPTGSEVAVDYLLNVDLSNITGFTSSELEISNLKYTLEGTNTEEDVLVDEVTGDYLLEESLADVLAGNEVTFKIYITWIDSEDLEGSLADSQKGATIDNILIPVRAVARQHIEGAYIVTFKDGEETLSTLQVPERGKASRPETDPLKENYAFVDWYADPELETLFDFTSTITENTTIYAKWKDGVAPTVTIASINNSPDHLFAIKANVEITDDNSGVDYSNCKYVFTNSNEPIGTNIENYTDGTISNTGVIEKPKGAETYYLHVLATDIEGNAVEKISDNSVTVNSVANFPYDSSKTFETISLMPGEYQFECWGAKGGGSLGGNGAYTKGIVNLNEDKTIYAYIGSTTSTTTGGYNGGGNGAYYGGGGATDFRTKNGSWNNSASLASRIMVAAGGSGGYAVNGMAGGELNGILSSGFTGTGATQKSAGTGGSFGIANASTKYTGAGGGYYAGGTAEKTVTMNEWIGNENDTVTLDGTYKIKYGKNSSWYYGIFTGSVKLSNDVFGDPLQGTVKEGYKVERYHYISSGGSSYISGHEGCIGITSETNVTPKVSAYSNIQNSYHYSGIIFTNTNMIAGNASMPGYNNNSITGNSGNGYARVTNRN